MRGPRDLNVVFLYRKNIDLYRVDPGLDQVEGERPVLA